MAWRPHYMHECDCGEFLVLLFIHLLFVHLLFIRLQITVSSGGMLVQKLNISDLQSGNGTFDGTMVYAQNKVQSMVLKTKPSTCLLGGLYHLLCKKLLLSHCIQPIQRSTSNNNLQKYDACIPSWTESIGRLSFDLIQVSRGRTVFSWQTLSACLVLTYSLQQVDVVSESSVTTLKVSLWPGMDCNDHGGLWQNYPINPIRMSKGIFLLCTPWYLQHIWCSLSLWEVTWC